MCSYHKTVISKDNVYLRRGERRQGVDKPIFVGMDATFCGKCLSALLGSVRGNSTLLSTEGMKELKYSISFP